MILQPTTSLWRYILSWQSCDAIRPHHYRDGPKEDTLLDHPLVPPSGYPLYDGL